MTFLIHPSTVFRICRIKSGASRITVMTYTPARDSIYTIVANNKAKHRFFQPQKNPRQIQLASVDGRGFHGLFFGRSSISNRHFMTMEWNLIELYNFCSIKNGAHYNKSSSSFQIAFFFREHFFLVCMYSTTIWFLFDFERAVDS